MARQRNYNLIKAAMWYSIGNILIRGVSFFALPIFTGLMSTYEYGIYSMYTSYLSLFETFILFGLSNTIAMAKFTKDIDDDSYLSSILIIPPLLTFTAGCFINVYLCVNSSLAGMNATLWNYLLVNSAMGAIAGIIQSRVILDGRYKLYLAYSAILTMGNLGLSLFLCYTVFRTHEIYMARVIGNCVASAVGVLFIFLCTGFKKKIEKIYFSVAFRWGVPLLLHTLATVLLTQTDRIFIQNMDSYSSVGIYNIAETIIIIPLTLQSSFRSALQPWFYNELEQKNYTRIQKTNDKYIILFAVITAELCLIAPEIIHIFTDKAYWDSIYSLIPLLISVFGEMLYSIPVSLEAFHKKATYIMTGTLICVACNIVLDIVFILSFGYIAAAYATMLSKLLLFLLHHLLSKKLDRTPLFQKRYVVGSLATLLGLNLFIVTHLEAIFLRLSLFALIGLAFLWGVWKSREELLELLNKNA